MTKKEIIRLCIIIFCVLHMAAIGAYSLPIHDGYPRLQSLRTALSKPFTPYLLLTGQWQQWNMFSPDPLRRVTEYIMEVQTAGGWERRSVVSVHNVEWWRRGTYSKLLLNALNPWEAYYREPIAQRFLASLCVPLNLLPGTSLRVVYSYYDIPKHNGIMPARDWQRWTPVVQEQIGTVATCPATSTSSG